MADFARLAARLARLEAAQPRPALQAPAMITVPSWATEELAAEEYAAALRARFPGTHVEHLRLSGPRPAGLLSMWSTGAWLTREPTHAELADLRPDLRPPPPSTHRADWKAPHAE